MPECSAPSVPVGNTLSHLHLSIKNQLINKTQRPALALSNITQCTPYLFHLMLIFKPIVTRFLVENLGEPNTLHQHYRLYQLNSK